MAIIVMKFGGTSVADIDRIKSAAERVKYEYDQGHQVAVIVSAMAGVTNQLVNYVQDTSKMYDSREYDSVVATGEQVSAGLMAIALGDIGVSARSWLGWQVPIKTSAIHGKARIETIEISAIKSHFEDNMVAVVAGFQGVSPKDRITTLGRGGSDTSAVALAVALGADRCDIYTDVDGVYTADPRLVPKAKKLEKIDYETMLESASLGAKVLHSRSVELAMNFDMPLRVLSAFVDLPGTIICREEDMVEQLIVSSVTYSRDEAKITLYQINDKPGVASAVFGALSDESINVDMIVQSVADENALTDMTFTVNEADLERAKSIIEAKKDKIGYSSINADPHVVKISVIGIGMRSHTGVAERMFRTLSENGVNIQVISTSEIKISTLIREDQLELALQSLHTAFGLDN